MSGMEEGKETKVEHEMEETVSGGFKGTIERLKDLIWAPTIILALVSLLAYVGASVYEIAYCNHFGIPRDLITVNWLRFGINLPVLAMLPVAFLIPIIVRRLSNRERKNSGWAIFFIALITFGLTTLMLWFYHNHLIGANWQWSLLAVTCSLSILSVSIAFGLSSLGDKNKWFVVVMVLISIFAFIFFYADTGSREAATAKEYPVLSSNQSMVVLRIYEDNAICAPLKNESGSHTIIREFTILPVENITLVYEQIGPLEKPK